MYHHLRTSHYRLPGPNRPTARVVQPPLLSQGNMQLARPNNRLYPGPKQMTFLIWMRVATAHGPFSALTYIVETRFELHCVVQDNNSQTALPELPQSPWCCSQNRYVALLHSGLLYCYSMQA